MKLLQPVILFFLISSCSTVDRIQYGDQLVDLSRKNLEQIPEEVFLKKDTKILRLYGNSLDSISYRIAELEQLEELYIGRNDLHSLPPEIGKLKHLKVLSVQYNHIDSLPVEIGDLDSLEQLWLNQNQLRSLPPSIGRLKKLELLQLKFNWLDSLPAEIYDCTSLEFIYLNRNNLRGLPEGIEKLTRLKELYLSGAGQLTSVPESICSLRLLEVLEIDNFTVLPTCVLVRQTGRLTIIRR